MTVKDIATRWEVIALAETPCEPMGGLGTADTGLCRVTLQRGEEQRAVFMPPPGVRRYFSDEELSACADAAE